MLTYHAYAAWVRPIPEALDLAKTGPLLCGGVTVFAPFLIHYVPSTARAFERLRSGKARYRVVLEKDRS